MDLQDYVAWAKEHGGITENQVEEFVRMAKEYDNSPNVVDGIAFIALTNHVRADIMLDILRHRSLESLPKPKSDPEA